MPENSKILIDSQGRRDNLRSNKYTLNSPYDLTNDIVSRSLDIVFNTTGYDLRFNPYIDLVERLIDAGNSPLVRNSGERLAVEFGRRALVNLGQKYVIGPLTKEPNNYVTKADYRITNFELDPNYDTTKKVLFETIGLRDMTNIFDRYDGKTQDLSDINYYYLGFVYKEKLNNYSNLSPFFKYGVPTKNTFSFSDQSLFFRNMYDKDFFDTMIEDSSSSLVSYTKRNYIRIYEKINTRLTPDFSSQKLNIYGDNGFGFNENKDFELKTDIFNLNDVSLGYTYRSDAAENATIRQTYGVKRGLLYLNGKIAEETNTIAQDKDYYTDDNAIIKKYKGNGECRTWSIFNGYDSYSKAVRFEGNGNKDSVIGRSVMPNIVPYSDDIIPYDKQKLFFSIEHLGLRQKNDDCDTGPNGGKLMWFVPYDLKISDNNSNSYLETSFLGRPELVYSYNNTSRVLSLSFKLLMDTVTDFRNLTETAENYKNFLYNCGNIANKVADQNNIKETKELKKDQIVETKEVKKSNILSLPCQLKYYFKNDLFIINDPADYSPTDPYSNGGKPFSAIGFTENDNFYSFIEQTIEQIAANLDKEINISIEGNCSNLADTRYNIALGMRRSNNMMLKIIQEFNDNYDEQITNQKVIGTGPAVTNIKTQFVDLKLKKSSSLKYKWNYGKGSIVFTLITKGEDSGSANDTKKEINKPNIIKERFAELTKFTVTDLIESTNPTDNNQIKPSIDNVSQQQQENVDAGTIVNDPCDTNLNLRFEEPKKEDNFPMGFEQLRKFTPIFNSQTPYDFTKRYIFLHKLNRPSKLNVVNQPDNTVFGRMPAFVLRIGDFIHSKAIARSINFDMSDSMWDLNPEGMGAIPMTCNVTMDIVLLGGDSLEGPISRIQTANDNNFIANSTFSTSRNGLYRNNRIVTNRF